MIAFFRPPMLLLLMLASLSGCSALSALNDASQPLEIYELRTPEVTGTASRRSTEVIVEEPIASGALATERIMVQPAPLQAQYLPGVRWSDTAPVMLQTLMVRSLAETGALASVGRSPVGTRADFAVLSELTDFQVEAGEAEADVLVRVRLIVRLVQESDSRVVASRTFANTASAPSTDPAPVAAAFDAATSRLLSDAVSWIVLQAR